MYHLSKFRLLIPVLLCQLPFTSAEAIPLGQTCFKDINPSTPSADFLLVDDGTVKHNKTGLWWSRCNEGQTWNSVNNTCTGSSTRYLWDAAMVRAVEANQSQYLGHNDWRLPNIKELASIIEYSCHGTAETNQEVVTTNGFMTPYYGIAINSTVFPGADDNDNDISHWYWSSTPYANDATPYQSGTKLAWGIGFTFGNVNIGPTEATQFGNYLWDAKGWVRLVRGGQTADSTDLITNTTTSLTAAPEASSTYGNAVVLTATLVPNVATGTVSFKKDNVAISGCATQTITAGVATCSFTPDVGTYSLSADYSGDNGNVSSSAAALNYSVSQATQTINVTFGAGSNITPVPGGSVTLNATGGGSGNPITWHNYKPELCSVSGNVVTYRNNGTCVLGAQQAGNANYSAAAENVVFIHVPFQLSYIAGPNGSLSGNASQRVITGAAGSTVLAIANPGYHFVSWSDGVNTPSRLESNVRANLGVTAIFAQDFVAPAPVVTYSLQYQAAAHGRLSGSSVQSVDEGLSGSSVTAIADTGYHFVNWSDGLTTASRSDSSVRANLSVTANFAPDRLTLSYAIEGKGSISGSASQTVDYAGNGSSVTAVADAGYFFIAWSDGLTSASRSDSNIKSNFSVSAKFADACTAAKQITLPSGTDLTACSQTANANAGSSAPLSLSSPAADTSGKTLLQQLQELLSTALPGSALQQAANNNVEVVVSDAVYTLLPVKIEKAAADDVPGTRFTQDGQIRMVTPQNNVLYFSASVADFEAFKAALTRIGLQADGAQHDYGNLQIQPAALLGKAKAKAAADKSYFSARPNPATQAATLQDGKVHGVELAQIPGVLMLENDLGVPHFKMAYLFYTDADKKLRQQALPPVPADWDSLLAALEANGFSKATLQPDGLITGTKAGKSYRALMNYAVTPGAGASDKAHFEAAADVNQDGISDLTVIYPNGEAQDILLLQ